jgi:hypothetical protein
VVPEPGQGEGLILSAQTAESADPIGSLFARQPIGRRAQSQSAGLRPSPFSRPQALQTLAVGVATIRGDEVSDAKTDVNRVPQAWPSPQGRGAPEA